MELKATILVAEDDPGDALLLELALKKALANVAVQFVRDGREAMHYLGGEGCFADRQHFPAPRMMVLDLKLPVVNGYDVLAWVRDQPELKRMRIVVLTGCDEASDINRARELGASCLLVKPPTSDGLSDLIRELQTQWRNSEGDGEDR